MRSSAINPVRTYRLGEEYKKVKRQAWKKLGAFAEDMKVLELATALGSDQDNNLELR